MHNEKQVLLLNKILEATKSRFSLGFEAFLLFEASKFFNYHCDSTFVPTAKLLINIPAFQSSFIILRDQKN